MNRNVEQFGEIMEKCKLIDPIAPEVQRHIRINKKKQFKKTLQRTGKYSFWFGLVASVFFNLKKMGISISIIKSTIIVAASSAVVAASVGAGAYYTVKKVILPKLDETEKQETGSNVILENSKISDRNKVKNLDDSNNIISEKNPKKEKIIPETTNLAAKRIAIQPFLGENIENDFVRLVAETIFSETRTLAGKDRVVLGSRSQKKSGMMLMGSIEALEGNYTINARVVRVKDSKILLYVSETVGSKDEISNACRKISKKVAKTIQ